VSVEVPDGEFIVLVGPSGCGKSTTLRMIAGLEGIDGGTISIAGREVNDLHPADRDIAMVFQSYALYPHMSVYNNIAYGLAPERAARRDRGARGARRAMLKLDALLKRRPAQLSGGQRQRVALGRAIVRQPAVFLMDEPLSNLDAKLRVEMRAELTRLHSELGVTTVYVTHDQVEAMTMGNRIVVMNAGRIEQLGTPLEVYARPASLFVARFLGLPEINTIDGRMTGGSAFEGGGIRIELPGVTLPDRDVVLGLRPQALLGRLGDIAGPSLGVAEIDGRRASRAGEFRDGPARDDAADDQHRAGRRHSARHPRFHRRRLERAAFLRSVERPPAGDCLTSECLRRGL
jgi:sn-glycerol 3-phosphate transport system ATP-binding protein